MVPLTAELMASGAMLLTAIAALTGSLWQGAKTRAEVAQITHEMNPNSGASLRDAVNRIDERVADLKQSIGGIRDDVRADRKALIAVQRDAAVTHEAIHIRLARIERNQQREPQD